LMLVVLVLEAESSFFFVATMGNFTAKDDM